MGAGWKDIKILIAGATGFVGRSLCAELFRHGCSVRAAMRFENSPIAGVDVAIVGAIDGETNWKDALIDVDVVIHLAASVHIMHDDSNDPLAEFHRVNVAGAEHLARCVAANGVRRLVYASSLKVSGEATGEGVKFSEVELPSNSRHLWCFQVGSRASFAPCDRRDRVGSDGRPSAAVESF